MAKKKKAKQFTLTKYILTLFLIGFAYIALNIFSNLVSARIIDLHPTTTEVTTTSENEDTEAILLATKDKLVEANIYIQTNFGTQAEIGSGVIVNQDESYYYALTNYHVLDGNGNVIDSKSVQTSDGVVSDFEVVIQNNELDLAYIRFTKTSREELIPLNLYSSELINTDNLCVSIGNPYGNIATVNYGEVIRTTTIHELELTHTAIEHNANLSNGSSGGALVDIYGNLIGINTWEKDGFYYAIPISVINIFIQEI